MSVDTLSKPAAALFATAFSHIGEGDTDYKSGGLRDFFLYRDLASLPPRTARSWPSS
jgi:hypothetical protein